MHFAVQQKVAQHCKSTILQKKSTWEFMLLPWFNLGKAELWESERESSGHVYRLDIGSGP